MTEMTTHCLGIHSYIIRKSCTDPITSWGIILVKIPKEYGIVNHYDVDLNNYKETNGIALSSQNDMHIVGHMMENIKFLLVRRKHSIGFSEFVRGNYAVDQINGIRSLFKQMIPEELVLIKNSTFDQLWSFCWGKDNAVETIKKGYQESLEKFTKLKSKTSVECDLDWYTDVVPDFTFPEWGFPKGRKKRGEDDLICAMREFNEKTGLMPDDINLINIKPIREDLCGTDGKHYRHIYFLAELKDSAKQIAAYDKSEIGACDFYTYRQSSEELIREYHHDKRRILNKIIEYYAGLVATNRLLATTTTVTTTSATNMTTTANNAWKVTDSD